MSLAIEETSDDQVEVIIEAVYRFLHGEAEKTLKLPWNTKCKQQLGSQT